MDKFAVAAAADAYTLLMLLSVNNMKVTRMNTISFHFLPYKLGRYRENRSASLALHHAFLYNDSTNGVVKHLRETAFQSSKLNHGDIVYRWIVKAH